MRNIPLTRLESNPREVLNECADSGQAFIIELPDHRLVAIQSLEPNGENPLIGDAWNSYPEFKKLEAYLKIKLRKQFLSSSGD